MSNDGLVMLLTRLAQDAAVLLDSEEATKQGIILPILSNLDWNRDNVREVVPEHRVENGRVDYCLRLNQRSAVFIEAKRTDQELDRHQEQLLGYAFREGVELAVLTNGVLWWLYLPLLQGSWEQRKFFTIDISQQDAATAAGHFSRFLGRGAVADGSAVRQAQLLHESHTKERQTAATLPRAWQQLLSEPDESLVELLADRVESLCGHKPTPDQIEEFLAEFVLRGSAPVPSPSQPTRVPPASPVQPHGYTYQRPIGFRFLGVSHRASTWKSILVDLCAEIATRHPNTFVKVLSLKGRKRNYFAPDYQNMTSPEAIRGTSIFVETNLSANDAAKRCNQILQLFGYQVGDFEVTTG